MTYNVALRMLSTAVIVGTLLVGCGGPGKPDNKSAIITHYPTRFHGISVHRVLWSKTLPYTEQISPVPWKNLAPKSFAITPESAVSDAARAFPEFGKAKIIYIQATGIVGQGTGDPRSAYVVEFVGSKDLIPNGQYSTPPTIEYVVVIVDGKTGRAKVALEAGNGVGP